MIGINITSSLEVDNVLVAETRSHLGGLFYSYWVNGGTRGFTFSCKKANQHVIAYLHTLKEKAE